MTAWQGYQSQLRALPTLGDKAKNYPPLPFIPNVIQPPSIIINIILAITISRSLKCPILELVECIIYMLNLVIIFKKKKYSLFMYTNKYTLLVSIEIF